MKQTVEQRYDIKFCVKLNKFATKSLFMLQEVFRKDSLCTSQIFKRHKAKKNEREYIGDV